MVSGAGAAPPSPPAPPSPDDDPFHLSWTDPILDLRRKGVPSACFWAVSRLAASSASAAASASAESRFISSR